MGTSQWNEMADEHGFIAVYPSGTTLRSSGTGVLPKVWLLRPEADLLANVRFVSELIDTLEEVGAWGRLLLSESVFLIVAAPARSLSAIRYSAAVRTQCVKTLFLALVSTQALHSMEEYLFRLYEVFPPAQFVSGLISRDLQRGFVIANLALLTLGFGCYLGPIRHDWDMAVPIA
jgi:hypothetical protein